MSFFRQQISDFIAAVVKFMNVFFPGNDITVYMRRGAFSKFIKPQLNPAGNPNPPGPFGRSGLRRVGGNEEECK